MQTTIQKERKSLDSELRQRVNKALADLPSQRGNMVLYTKAGIFLILYAGLYTTPFFFAVPWWLMIIGALLSGVVMAGIGTGIMHDANHGSFARKEWVNKLFGNTLYLVGGYVPNWKMQHNVIHHTQTNVHEHDDDLDSRGVLRFSPHQELKSHHKYQMFYAPFLYSIMTILWISSKDFQQARRYKKEGRQSFQNIRHHIFWITVSKVLYYLVWIVIPILFWKVSNGMVVLAFFVMHFSAGLLLGLIFQPAHVSSLTMFQDSPVSGRSRSEHQIRTSCNYAMNNKFVTWLAGGLNFQIEHHLFPYISHVHYPKIAPVVKRFCEEFNLPYNNLGSFWDAQVDHFKFLWKLGQQESL